MAKSLEEVTEWLEFTFRGHDQPLWEEVWKEKRDPSHSKESIPLYIRWGHMKETVCLSNSQLFVFLRPLKKTRHFGHVLEGIKNTQNNTNRKTIITLPLLLQKTSLGDHNSFPCYVPAIGLTFDTGCLFQMPERHILASFFGVGFTS